MGSSTIVVGWGLGIALLVLTAIATGVAVAGRLGVGLATVVALGRAILQLVAVSAVIVAVVRSWPATIGFVLLMVGVGEPGHALRATV